MLARSTLVALLALALGCSPLPAPADAGDDAGAVATDCPSPPQHRENLTACRPRGGDYEPRVASSAFDSWPACISDDGAYHPIDPNISTVARVAAFEQVGDLLWRGGRVPSAGDFLSARILYAQDQGLDSRVQRREDVHYPAAAQPCSTAGVPEQNPDRCVGPAKLLPILNDAFVRGARGEAPRLHAARIEAALLWFLYVSALSEVMSCGTRPQDCDSAWAYYSGGTPRDAPAGLARYVRALSAQTHDRAYDGALAVRCWRNLDNETGLAANPSQQLAARGQLDRAMLRGVAVVLRQRIAELQCADEEGAEARTAFIGILAGLLEREALARDGSWGQVLRTSTSGSTVDVTSATTALDMLFPCP